MRKIHKNCELKRMGRPRCCTDEWPDKPKAWCSYCLRIEKKKCHAPQRPTNKKGRPQNKRSHANCGPMTQQGMMGAHGREMYPQGFLRLTGCHKSNRQKEDAASRAFGEKSIVDHRVTPSCRQ